MMLKKLEYAVWTAITGEDALQMMNGSPPAIVITDTVLPKMSGINLLKTMKQDTRLKTIPVIMHSSQINQAVRETCTLAGCAGFVFKPVEPDALYRVIQAAAEAEPRQTIRIDTCLKAHVEGGPDSVGAVRVEEVTTISDGVLYIKSLVHEPVSSVIALRLFIRNKEIKVKAVVLYSSVKIGEPYKVPGMGMKFVTISWEDKAFIGVFIKQQITKDITLND